MTPATTTTTRRDVDDEVAADWRTLDADFGLSAARRRVVGRLRHDSGWDRTPPAPGLTPRSTDRGLQRPIASRSRVDGQYSPRCIYSTVAAVFRAPVHTTHEHGPSTRPVNTGSVYRVPVFTGRVDKKTLHDNVFANTARRHGCSVDTTRDHGPWTRPVNTAREHGCHAISTVREV